MNELRKCPRFDVVLKARFETEIEFQEALVRSLCSGGLFLATDSPFDAGFHFLLEIDFPAKNRTIRGKCEVVWVNQVEAENYPTGMGVRFVEMSPEDEKLLAEHLRQLEKKVS